MHYPFADVAVLSSENASDKKLIVDNLSLKDVFCGVYIKRGAVFWGHKRKKETIEYV